MPPYSFPFVRWFEYAHPRGFHRTSTLPPSNASQDAYARLNGRADRLLRCMGSRGAAVSGGRQACRARLRTHIAGSVISRWTMALALCARVACIHTKRIAASSVSQHARCSRETYSRRRADALNRGQTRSRAACAMSAMLPSGWRCGGWGCEGRFAAVARNGRTSWSCTCATL